MSAWPRRARDDRFAESVIAWQRRHGRHDLPWQHSRDAYRIWLSEIMLQQTQVTAVIPFFQRFVARFPNLRALAVASEEEVLAQWSGLGYYARARNLHRAANEIQARYGGEFPAQFDDIAAMPGVGRSTAGAIAVFAFGRPYPVVDGNVKRVLSRYFGIEGYPGDRNVSDALWALAQRQLPQRGIEAYTQGLMDLGATVCTRAAPRCAACPVAPLCVAHREGRAHMLPATRPHKARPQRTTTMLILAHGAQVLLEKRPSAGIWGGLWSFPESPDGTDIVHACRQRYGAELAQVETLTPVTHGFTHFALLITPKLCRVARLEPRAQYPALAWVDIQDAQRIAVPAPVRRLLQALPQRPSGAVQQPGQS